jgi:hypothetical protein
MLECLLNVIYRAEWHALSHSDRIRSEGESILTRVHQTILASVPEALA